MFEKETASERRVGDRVPRREAALDSQLLETKTIDAEIAVLIEKEKARRLVGSPNNASLGIARLDYEVGLVTRGRTKVRTPE